MPKRKGKLVFSNAKGGLLRKYGKLSTAAAELGMDKTSLSHKLHGRRRFSSQEQRKIAARLQMPIDEAFEPFYY